jgi:L-xylulokinase
MTSPASRYLLGIDNGGTMSKAALFDTSGGESACASRKVVHLEPHPGWSERDADVVWEDTADAIREVIETAGVDPADIACVACTGYGNGLFLVDENGKPVRNAIHSMDGRAASYSEAWIAAGVDDVVLPMTAQCIWPAQPNALLAWMRDHEPQTMKRARWVLLAKDFTRTQLTGEIWVERTDMSGSSLMNVVTGEYDDAVLEAFGLLDMKRLLPPLRHTHDLCGAVTAEAAARTGLAEGTPVAGGLFDIDACALASGIIDEGQMSLVAGTWGNNQYIAKEPLIDKDLFMATCYSVPGWFLMLEGSPTSAGNLEWFLDRLVREEGEAGAAVYQRCDEAVAATGPEDSDIIFLPFLYGTNEKSAAKSSFLGLEEHHTRDDLLRAVYEGIVFSHHHHLQRLLQFRDVPDCIRMTGGAAHSEVWVQMFADCFQIPVEVPTGTELGALGAAIAGAVATGIYPGYREAVAGMTSVACRYKPDPLKAEVYAGKYQRYKKAVTVLDELWK